MQGSPRQQSAGPVELERYPADVLVIRVDGGPPGRLRRGSERCFVRHPVYRQSRTPPQPELGRAGERVERVRPSAIQGHTDGELQR